MKKVKLVLWILIALMVISLIGLNVYGIYSAKTKGVVHPEISFEIENYGTVKMELYPEYAPNTVANIIKLAQNGFYNNKVIYGKDEVCLYFGRNSEGEPENPKTSILDTSIEVGSENDYEYTTEGEFLANGYEDNTLRHEKGVVTIMRYDYTQYFSDLIDESYNSGCAQMGIMMDNASTLNGVYTAFAKITEGMDIIEKIYNEEKVAVPEAKEGEEAPEEEPIDKFETYPVIKSATVNTFDKDYGMPEIEEAFDYNAYMNKMLSSYYSTEQ